MEKAGLAGFRPARGRDQLDSRLRTLRVHPKSLHEASADVSTVNDSSILSRPPGVERLRAHRKACPAPPPGRLR